MKNWSPFPKKSSSNLANTNQAAINSRKNSPSQVSWKVGRKVTKPGVKSVNARSKPVSKLNSKGSTKLSSGGLSKSSYKGKVEKSAPGKFIVILFQYHKIRVQINNSVLYGKGRK